MKDASDDVKDHRETPHNIEAEQNLLGAIFVNPEAFDRVSDFLEADHFYVKLHQLIFGHIAKLISAGQQATPVTLKTYFDQTTPGHDGLTAQQYLGRLAANATTIINARDYGRTIHDLATRRQLIVIGEDMWNVAFDSPVDFPPKEQIEEVETRLFALVERGEQNKESAFAEAASAAAQAVSNAHRGGSVGLLTGLADLDRKTGGLHSTDLIIVGGRPSMGKSALATTIANNVGSEGTAVGFYSLEMNKEQVATRIICARSGISMHRAWNGQLDEEELARFQAMAATVSALPIVIDESGGISIAQLAGRAASNADTGSGC